MNGLEVYMHLLIRKVGLTFFWKLLADLALASGFILFCNHFPEFKNVYVSGGGEHGDARKQSSM